MKLQTKKQREEFAVKTFSICVVTALLVSLIISLISVLGLAGFLIFALVFFGVIFSFVVIILAVVYWVGRGTE